MTDEEIKEYWRAAYCDEKHKKEELEAQIDKMKCCSNCKYYKFQNDAKYCTCTKRWKTQRKELSKL